MEPSEKNNPNGQHGLYYPESKAEYRRIKQAKALGIKNPYKHFINILPSNLQKITKIKAG